MFTTDFITALDSARTLAFIDEIARDLWRVYGAGKIGDGDAEHIAARIEEARQRVRPKNKVLALAEPLAAISIFPARKRRCVSPDRAKSRKRRRQLAYSGPLPPTLAAGFTIGQLATLRIVADEVVTRGACMLTLAEIAARAGVGVTTARNAIQTATADGLLVVIARPRRGAPNLPNVVKIISQEWRTWIARGPKRGSKMSNPTDRSTKFTPSTGPQSSPERIQRDITTNEKRLRRGIAKNTKMKKTAQDRQQQVT